MRKTVFVLLILLLASITRLWMLDAPDIQEDEHHYIEDSFRFLNDDPYMSVRYHAQDHPQPSIGHPFLYQLLQAGIFNFLGISVYTARLVSAFSGILTVLTFFMFNRKLGGRVSYLGAFLLAILPMAVRYNRVAYLDSLLTLFITFCAVCAWRYIQSKNLLWLIAGGLSTGMAISTKLNGFYVIFVFTGIIFFSKTGGLKKIKFKIFELGLFLLSFGIIAFLFNDPHSYFDGIINPSDPAFRLFGDGNLVRILEQYTSPYYIFRFLATNAILFSPVLLLLVLFSLIKLVVDLKSTINRFFIFWILPLFVIFIIHGIDNSGAYRWIPLLPPLLLLISYKISHFDKQRQYFFVWLMSLTVLPFLFLYGWCLSKLPFANIPVTHNRICSNTYYQDVIKTVNDLTLKNSKIIFLPQNYYPLFALRRDLSWAYSFSDDYDFYVLDKPISDRIFFDNNEYFGSYASYQDGLQLERYFYKRSAL